MHMADALISPVVGGTMWAAAAGIAGAAARKMRFDENDGKIPLMAVAGAFVFSAQMINFSIPCTGSSGHLGGGLLLAALLGPHAAFLTMACILATQALFFADGGLLALGCNIFNLGFYTCYVAYPLIWRPLVGNAPSRGRIFAASVLAAAAGLQLGALSVVVETTLSGVTDLPFATFLALMQPVHLAIGVVEGLVTASIAAFVWRARPEMLADCAPRLAGGRVSRSGVLASLALAALLAGGVLSWFASSNPDGLEWSIFKVAGKEEVESAGPVHQELAAIQERTAIMPDYGFKTEKTAEEEEGGAHAAWPAVDAGTSLAGLVGAGVTLLLTGLAGVCVRFARRRGKPSEA